MSKNCKGRAVRGRKEPFSLYTIFIFECLYVPYLKVTDSLKSKILHIVIDTYIRE